MNDKVNGTDTTVHEAPADKFAGVAEEVQEQMSAYIEELKGSYDPNIVYMALINVQLNDFNRMLHANPEAAKRDFGHLMEDVMNTMSLMVGLKQAGDEPRITQFMALRNEIMERKNTIISALLQQLGG